MININKIEGIKSFKGYKIPTYNYFILFNKDIPKENVKRLLHLCNDLTYIDNSVFYCVKEKNVKKQIDRYFNFVKEKYDKLDITKDELFNKFNPQEILVFRNQKDEIIIEE